MAFYYNGTEKTKQERYIINDDLKNRQNKTQ